MYLGPFNGCLAHLLAVFKTLYLERKNGADLKLFKTMQKISNLTI